MTNEMSLFSQIDWHQLSSQVREEARLRRKLFPVISAFRWWARRPSRLFGAILDAAGLVRVADPFGGGGTVTIEAARRRLPVYTQELYPWPVFGLATILKPVSLDELDKTAQWLLDVLAPLRKFYLRSDGREISHILRVRLGTCPKCGEDMALFTTPMISLASRRKNESQAYYGCPTCATVWSGPRDPAPKHCPVCQAPLPQQTVKGRFQCTLCGYLAPWTEFVKGQPQWRPVLVQEVVYINGQFRTNIRPVDPKDPVEALPASVSFPQLQQPIPPGLETNRLLNAGFRFWGDLYTDRQAAILLEGLRVLTEMERPYRDHLALVILGLSEMPAFLTRWDRYHPKAIEALAHHRYASTSISVETNLLSPIGRGTLPRRLQALRKATEWICREIGIDQKVYLLLSSSPRLDLTLESEEAGIYIALGSSVQMALRNETIDLILTDPPYHDDIQYGELARLFHFWLGFYKKPLSINETGEASYNASQGRDLENYTRILVGCFQECRRVLRQGGRLVFTFRNRKLKAWQALCTALHQAGFHIHALATVQTDEIWDPTRKQSKSMRYDLVIECVDWKTPTLEQIFLWVGSTTEEKALLAMGLAMADCLQRGEVKRLPEFYRKWGEQLGVTENDWIR